MIGDIALGDLHTVLVEHVANLRGRKILVPGNHDRCWTGRNKHETSRSDYLRFGGFERIVDATKPMRIGRKKVRISHFPYLLDDTYDLKYLDHRPRDDGSWLLHGHVHEKWRQRGRQINVGVDAWDFAPVSEEAIAATVASTIAALASPRAGGKAASTAGSPQAQASAATARAPNRCRIVERLVRP